MFGRPTCIVKEEESTRRANAENEVQQPEVEFSEALLWGQLYRPLWVLPVLPPSKSFYGFLHYPCILSLSPVEPDLAAGGMCSFNFAHIQLLYTAMRGIPIALCRISNKIPKQC